MAVALGVLGLFYLLLPIHLPDAEDHMSSERCLALADRPPQDDAQALANLEQCSMAVPEDVELLADLGSAYVAAGRPADAESTYRKVIAIDPEYADVHVHLARLLLQRGAVREAGEHASAAQQLQPNRQAIEELVQQITSAGSP
jgi:Flp pilus assembly protein TadD